MQIEINEKNYPIEITYKRIKNMYLSKLPNNRTF